MGVWFAADRMDGAIRKKDMPKLEMLLSKGANPDAGSGDFYNVPPIETAIKENNPEAVSLLMDYLLKLPKPAHSLKGNALLSMALERRFFEVAAALLEKDPGMIDRLSGGRSPLQRAARIGDIESATYLLQHGADPFVKCGDKRNALYYAKQEKRDDMIALLQPYYHEEELRLLPCADGDVWEKKGDSKIAHITTDKTTGFKITDVFNFAVNERMVICQSLTSSQQSTETKVFDDCSPAVLEEALEALKMRGGGRDIASFLVKKRF